MKFEKKRSKELEIVDTTNRTNKRFLFPDGLRVLLLRCAHAAHAGAEPAGRGREGSQGAPARAVSELLDWRRRRRRRSSVVVVVDLFNLFNFFLFFFLILSSPPRHARRRRQRPRR
jgi:hypothetical protein